tara:strand:+ start:5108 stop:5755 length:648 start_codon:yes stop_codon:yes gene_type:complete
MFEPFEYKVIDNFLETQDLKIILNSLNPSEVNKISPNEVKIYKHFFKKGEIKNSSLTKEQVKKLHEKYHSKCISILEELCKEKIKIYDYSEMDIVLTGKNYKFPIHSDSPNKLLSCVIYLDPSENNGTFLYKDSKGNGKFEIKWLKNRALLFSRKENNTWHSYEGNNESTRIVLVYNLMTEQIKKVYEIENKNYYFGIFKTKLSPYLYKYFKVTL